jgi:hypothetical protein
VLLDKLGQPCAWKSVGQVNQRGPNASMNKSDLAVDKPANKNIVAVP